VKKNILITSAGRRVSLVEGFQEAQKSLGLDAEVMAIDMFPDWSSACRTADRKFTAPSVRSETYSTFLLDFVEKYEIGLIVPTIDTELIELSNFREKLLDLGCNVVISDVSLINVCRDKRLTQAVFKGLDIPVPKIYDLDSIEIPCFTKPYDGSLSVGAKKVETFDEARLIQASNEKQIFMQYISSETHSEYTVDTYYDRNGNLKCLIPRRRVEIRGGEISKGITTKGKIYDFLLPRMKHLDGARGCLTVQLFYSSTLNDFRGIEINPRFGGGFPLSYKAGANFPQWLLSEYLLSDTIGFNDSWEEGLAMARYDKEVFFRMGEMQH